MNRSIFALSVATFLDTVDRAFFTPDFGTYEKLTYFNNPRSFKLAVIGVYIGVFLVSLYTYYNRHVLGALVRRLDAEGCDSPENAKTLEALGFGKNIFIKTALTVGGALRSVVAFSPADDSARVGGIIAYASLNKERYRIKDDRIYLPKEKRDGAMSRFRTKGSGWLSVLLTAVLGLVSVIIVMKLAPHLVGLIDGMLASFDTAPDVLN